MQGYAQQSVGNFWIGAVDNWGRLGNRGKKNEKVVGGAFPGVHRQLRMILIQQFIFKTSTHLTITNASPTASDGSTSHHQPEPVG